MTIVFTVSFAVLIYFLNFLLKKTNNFIINKLRNERIYF